MIVIDPIVLCLRHFRTEKRLSQEVVAELSGMSPSTIYRIERGETDIKLSQIRRYLQAIEMRIDDVYLHLLLNQHTTDYGVTVMSHRLPVPVRKIFVECMYNMSEYLNSQLNK